MGTATLPPKEVAKVAPTLPVLKLVLPPGGLPTKGYKVRPEIGDGACGHVFDWLANLILPALSTTQVVTIPTLLGAIDAIPLDQQHPRWSQVWGDKQPLGEPPNTNRSVRVWCIREVLAHAARSKPPKVIIQHKVGGTRYNGYMLPE